jgi:hypothetical protein
MPASPDQQWHQLTAHYAQMWDDELLDLAPDYKDLTDMARQVLRDEMRRRNLGDPTPRAAAAPPRSPGSTPSGAAPRVSREIPAPSSQISAEELLRLTRHHRQLCDEDLLDLFEHLADLTPAARQVLGDEMKSRGISDPANALASLDPNLPEPLARAEALIEAREAAQRAARNSSGPREYTWKVDLCECDEWDQVWQIRRVLQRAGIESWARGATADNYQLMMRPRVMVAAEQLEEAQSIIVQPIPQDIIDESKLEIPEYQLPHCARCQDQEPTLIATEPSNQWLCESCGNEWRDPAVESNRI